MAADDTVSEATPSAVPAEGQSLSQILRRSISFTRLQGICGTIAALMSIGGALGYIIPQEPPRGEVLAIVQEARSGKPITDATVEVLTLKDALVTMVPPAAGAGTAKAPMKEGTYRLRVSHPQYTTESRQIYVLAGQTAQIKMRLSARPAPPPPPSPALAEKAPNSPYENIKKLFQQ
jgi:Carboxypeptidase regulatory-like domain